MTEEKFRERIEPPQAKPDGGPASDKSLREWFAGQALVGETANEAWENRPNACELIALHCYEQADAMIAARDS